MSSKIEYKGKHAVLIMQGQKEKVPGWLGEIFLAVIQYGDKEHLLYDVIPDSTNAADVDDLPQVQTFNDRGQAIAHFMNLEHNKRRWK